MSLGTVTYPAPNVAWPRDDRGGSARSMFVYTGPGAGAGGYPTGGDTIEAGQIKLGTIEYMSPAVATNVATTAAILLQYNKTTGKLQAFWTGAVVSTALAEVANATDLSGYSALMVAEGRG